MFVHSTIKPPTTRRSGLAMLVSVSVAAAWGCGGQPGASRVDQVDAARRFAHAVIVKRDVAAALELATPRLDKEYVRSFVENGRRDRLAIVPGANPKLSESCRYKEDNGLVPTGGSSSDACFAFWVVGEPVPSDGKWRLAWGKIRVFVSRDAPAKVTDASYQGGAILGHNPDRLEVVPADYDLIKL